VVLVIVAGGGVTNARCVGVPGVTVIGLLVAVVSVRLVSVAVNSHVPALVMVRAENVAIPAAAVALVVPPSLHEGVVEAADRVTTSVSPVEALTTTPLLCSIAAVNDPRTVPAATVEPGCVLNATWVGVFELKEIEFVVPAAIDRVWSVAVNAHGEPAEKFALAMLATPPLAVYPVKVPPAVQPLEEVEIVKVSAFPVFDPVSTLLYWSSTETVKGMATPNVPADAGCDVTTTWDGAAGVIVIAPLVTAPPCVASVAVMVHEAPVVMMTLLNASGEEA
jgi:hypothetical protein